MDPRTGDYVTLAEREGLPAAKAERFSVEVSGTADEVERLSTAFKEGRKYEVLYEAAMHKLRVVRVVGKRLSKSGHPALKAAGREILGELE
jgi:hypothetical protein